MRAFRRIFLIVFAISAAAFTAANLLLKSLNTPESGRPYRVEVNRLAFSIEQNGFDNIDLSKCEYVYNIEKFSAGFYNFDGDYMIREINGELYRFDYTVDNDRLSLNVVVMVNVILGVIIAAVIGMLLYVRAEIIRPFERLTSVPYELSKGNLTAPVKENKSRFFGKFLWGMDLLRENIEQHKKRELELQKEKKTLLLSLSHDIKTPLSAIKLYSKALSRNLYPNPEKQHEIAENITDKADEIEGYVAKIITASREEFLSLNVNNSEFYLSDLVKEISDYYSEKLALVKIKFTVEEYRNRLIYGDLDRSAEVLQNVIENAVKYGGDQSIELLFPEDDEGIMITVKNGGCTLDKSELTHIFESFQRGSNSKGVQGTGLGLYICRQLMHKMNGEIFAEINGSFISFTMVFNRAS